MIVHLTAVLGFLNRESIPILISLPYTITCQKIDLFGVLRNRRFDLNDPSGGNDVFNRSVSVKELYIVICVAAFIRYSADAAFIREAVAKQYSSYRRSGSDLVADNPATVLSRVPKAQNDLGQQRNSSNQRKDTE